MQNNFYGTKFKIHCGAVLKKITVQNLLKISQKITTDTYELKSRSFCLDLTCFTVYKRPYKILSSAVEPEPVDAGIFCWRRSR